jgi:single-strand DNA-binding protein
MNNVSFTGRLTADPDEPFRTNNGKAGLNLRVAINRGRDVDPTFVSVTCWNKTAENARQYLEKGSLIGVSGSLMSDEWTDDTGQWHQRIYVSAQSIDFLERRIENAGARPAAAAEGSAAGVV